MMYDVAGPAALTDAVTNIEDMYRVLVEDGYYTTPEVEAATCMLALSQKTKQNVKITTTTLPHCALSFHPLIWQEVPTGRVCSHGSNWFPCCAALFIALIPILFPSRGLSHNISCHWMPHHISFPHQLSCGFQSR